MAVQEMDSSIESLMHRWGSSISESMLDYRCQYFQLTHIDGCIGYHVESGCAIVMGDPICSRDNTSGLTQAFHDYCAENHWNVIYILTSESFATWMKQANLCRVMIEVGEELIFDPQDSPLEGSKGIKLRNKINHARNYGLKVSEFYNDDPQIANSMQQVSQTWLKARKGPQLYLGDLHLFENCMGRRWFYIKDGEQMTGIAILSRLEAHEGWLLKFLMALPEAHRGTSEYLMISILETLRNENCRYLTYGMVPGESLGEITGLGNVTTWIAQRVFKLIMCVFGMQQRKIYWQKYRPYSERLFVLFSNSHIGFKEIRALTKSFKINIRN